MKKKNSALSIKLDKPILLSREDGIRFLKALENPPKPNERLKAALYRYKLLRINKIGLIVCGDKRDYVRYSRKLLR